MFWNTYMINNHFSYLNLIYLFLTTHLTILTVTIYLHRSQAHRSLTVSSPLAHFFRFWCWFTTGQSTQQWTAVHRKHHAFCEKNGDPHSPQIFGLWTVLFKGVSLYQKEATNPETLEKYGKFTPNDWIENHVYKKHSWLGMLTLLALNLIFFGYHGIWMFMVQILWIPFWAAGVINGLGHFQGYRNFKTNDTSTNLIPFGFIIGGEELHNNHHAYPTSAKFSMKWYEFDWGWHVIKFLSFLKLVKINKMHELPVEHKEQKVFHEQSIEIFLSHRYFLWQLFQKHTKSKISDIIHEIRRNDETLKNYSPNKLKDIFYNISSPLSEKESQLLEKLLHHSFLKSIHEMKESLVELWNDKQITYQQLKDKLSSWCEKASQHQSDNIRMFKDQFICLKIAK